MSTTKILVAGLVGGVVAFFLGFLFYGLLLSDFFESNMIASTDVIRSEEEMKWIPMIIGHLTWGLLFAIIYGRWANISTFSTGAIAGAVIGGLVAATHNLINYASMNLMNFTGTLVDIVVMIVAGAITGGVVGWMLGRGKTS